MILDVGTIFALLLLAVCAGIWFSEQVLEGNRRKAKETKLVEIEPEEEEEPGERDPMSLRNGYGVVKDRNPTFAEQWVNIMNFNGESQLEGDYDEGEGTDR